MEKVLDVFRIVERSQVRGALARFPFVSRLSRIYACNNEFQLHTYLSL